jgi:hypothetical protein
VERRERSGPTGTVNASRGGTGLGEAKEEAVTAAPTESEFRPLCAGDSLDGWVLVREQPQTAWTASHGVVACSGRGRGWLRTARTYTDFVLRLDFAISKGGNSGVFLRSLLEGRPAYNGMEVQILDDAGTPPTVKSTGALYDAVAPATNPSRPAGEWNALEALCQGDHVRIAINGETVVDVRLDEDEHLKDRPREGYIGLQNHHSPVRFRNVRVREL